MSRPTLAQTQRLLWRLITAPEGAASGLAQLGAADRAVASSLVAGDPHLGALQRIDIYANMYFYRLHDALKEDFSAVRAILSADGFHNLVTDYLIAHPPSHYSLRYAGARLPDFLRHYAAARDWPYLADVATLEWAILDAFDAPDAPALAADTLAAVPPERWPDLRLQLAPSLRLLDLSWPADEIWRRARQGDAVAAEPRPTALRVWRQDFTVYHRRIDAAERAALGVAGRNGCFAELCEQVAADANESGGAERAFDILRQWLSDDLLCGVSVPATTASPPPGGDAHNGAG